MKKYMFQLWALTFLLPLAALAQKADNSAPIIDYDARFQPVLGKRGMVASQEVLATSIGLEILKQGGNAVDAAAAVGFALAVTLPKAGNLGGGGFMMVYLAEEDKTITLDFRETAPGKAHRDMYLDSEGNVDAKKARFSYLSAGTPGTPAGLTHALTKYGTMPLDKVMAPAIALARDGFEVSHGLNFDLGFYAKRLAVNPSTRAAYYDAEGNAPAVGSTLVQKDLAWSLSQIAQGGADAFYKGELGKKFSEAVIAGGGLISMDDLANYKVVEAPPVRGTYRGYDVVSMPPPSSGGVHIIQMLNILEEWPLGEYGANSAQTLHLMTEAMRVAYADRSKYLGDPAFCKVPVEGLISKEYAASLRKDIALQKARSSKEVHPGAVPGYESPDTTHYSVVDGKGNMVAVTYTLNFSFGSGIVAEGTGILLNNEMDDFSAKPGSPNAYGLLGGEANAIQPGKRPLSSMTPTFLFKDGKPFMVTGSPGGSRIITAVLQIILNVVDHNMNMAVASSMPRMHHQWFPNLIFVEQGISIDTLRILEQWGHKTKPTYAMGSTQSIMIRDGLLQGASDPRRTGASTQAF